MECQYCSKICKNKNSLVQHQIRCNSNPDRLLVKSNFTKYNEGVKNGTVLKPFTNKFTKAALEGRTVDVSDSTREKLSKIKKGTKYTDEYKAKISKFMQEAVKNNPDSYSAANVNGRVKKIEYKGVMLDGGWELLVAKWFDSNNIKWVRNKIGFDYEWNGSRTYFPDFFLPEFNLYVEVKGYERERDMEKWKVLSNLIIIKKDDIKKIKENTFSISM